MGSIISWCNANSGFMSAVLSLIAVCAAVGVPAWIAHRQDKIALFEKRYELYTKIKKFLWLDMHLELELLLGEGEDVDVNEAIKESAYRYISAQQPLSISFDEFMSDFDKGMSGYLKQFLDTADMITYLFDGNLGDSFDCLFCSYYNFVDESDTFPLEDMKQLAKKFIYFRTHALRNIERQLNL